MRADRLLAILLILQTRGRTTAFALAAELEVSERTIYRDLVALSTSGVPVYTEKGPGGGIALIEDYRTELTGLTSREANALFLVQALSPLRELGLEEALNNAMRKLYASLSEDQRSLSDQSEQLIYFDASPSQGDTQGGPFVQTIHQCIVKQRRVNLTVRQVITEKAEFIAEPYGLVAKGGEWQLACKIEGTLRMVRLEDVLAVDPVEQLFERDPDFDLRDFWQSWLDVYERNKQEFEVVAQVSPEAQPYAARIAPQVSDHNEDDAHGWRRMTFTFRDHFQARARLLPFGGAVKVLEPVALRFSLADLAAQIVKLYEENYPFRK